MYGYWSVSCNLHLLYLLQFFLSVHATLCYTVHEKRCYNDGLVNKKRKKNEKKSDYGVTAPTLTDARQPLGSLGQLKKTSYLHYVS